MADDPTLVQYSDRLQQAVDSVMRPDSFRIRQGRRERGRSSLNDHSDGGIYEYNGYFKLVLVVRDKVTSLHVVDGATWDGETSGPSIAKVNNVNFELEPWPAAELPGNRLVGLKFTAAQPAKDETPAAAAAVEIGLFEGYALPNDTAENCYYLLGRIFVETSGEGEQKKTSVIIQQDHVTGVAQIWWFGPCQSQ